KATSFLFGPIYFTNYNYKANTRLITTRLTRIKIVAIKDIRISEEIIVTYNDDYF
ncbi:hypothetical protein BGZ57DRAFT_711175, partial [Hyaloscypha finlandica]